MKVTVPNIGAGEKAEKGSLKKHQNMILRCLVGIACSVYFGCHSANIAIFQNQICRDTVFPATGPMHLVGACDLNFTRFFKMLNKNVCVKIEVSGPLEGRTEMEKKGKLVSTMQKKKKSTERGFEERGF